MKYIKLLILLVIIYSCENKNNSLIIKSPNKNISLEFKIEDGIPNYTVKKYNKTIIKKSNLGINLKKNLELSNNFKINKYNKKSFNSSWKPLYGEEKKIKRSSSSIMTSRH